MLEKSTGGISEAKMQKGDYAQGVRKAHGSIEWRRVEDRGMCWVTARSRLENPGGGASLWRID